MNDLRLSELLIDLQNEIRQLDGLVRDSKLESAFLVAYTMDKQLELFMERLNRIRWPEKT